ncbi:unnamed protein product [Symbiodinium pilosum]|uniref:Uncharacterized protein n=1 Tax=Symbiodinium pilosum TaxID=2952 RepID=A0A812NF27_SYMPI|nr:unnamed protein product [Symbiodinium pilosum]
MAPAWLLVAFLLPVTLLLYQVWNSYGPHGLATSTEEERQLRAFLQKVEAQNELAEDFLGEQWERRFQRGLGRTDLPNVTIITVDTSKPRVFGMLGAGNLHVRNAGAGSKWRSWWDKPRLFQKFLKKFSLAQPQRIEAWQWLDTASVMKGTVADLGDSSGWLRYHVWGML